MLLVLLLLHEDVRGNWERVLWRRNGGGALDVSGVMGEIMVFRRPDVGNSLGRRRGRVVLESLLLPGRDVDRGLWRIEARRERIRRCRVLVGRRIHGHRALGRRRRGVVVLRGMRMRWSRGRRGG